MSLIAVAHLLPDVDSDGKLWFRLDPFGAWLEIDLKPGTKVSIEGTVQAVEHHGGYVRDDEPPLQGEDSPVVLTPKTKFTLDTQGIRLFLSYEKGA